MEKIREIISKLAPEGEPSAAFWKLWKTRKHELKRLGVAVAKDENGFQVRLDRLRSLPPLPTVREFVDCPREKAAAMWESVDKAAAKKTGLEFHPEAPSYWNVWKLKGISALTIGKAEWLSSSRAKSLAALFHRKPHLPRFSKPNP